MAKLPSETRAALDQAREYQRGVKNVIGWLVEQQTNMPSSALSFINTVVAEFEKIDVPIEEWQSVLDADEEHRRKELSDFHRDATEKLAAADRKLKEAYDIRSQVADSVRDGSAEPASLLPGWSAVQMTRRRGQFVLAAGSGGHWPGYSWFWYVGLEGVKGSAAEGGAGSAIEAMDAAEKALQKIIEKE